MMTGGRQGFRTLEDGANVREGEEAAKFSRLGFGGQAAEPGAVEGRANGTLNGTSPFRVVPWAC